VTTPTGSTIAGQRLDRSKPIVAISIMRAGDSMLETFLNVVPDAQVGKILIQRDEATAGNPNF
jgi:uracil phosphoribosyltransferase